MLRPGDGEEMIDYLGIVADFNDKTFPDQVFPLPANLSTRLIAPTESRRKS